MNVSDEKGESGENSRFRPGPEVEAQRFRPAPEQRGEEQDRYRPGSPAEHNEEGPEVEAQRFRP